MRWQVIPTTKCHFEGAQRPRNLNFPSEISTRPGGRCQGREVYPERSRNTRNDKYVLGFSRQLLVILAALLLLSTACAPPPLKGTDLGKTPAPDFKLADQNGSTISLADFRGKVVVLTFLYTHCPDECPLIASKLAAVSASLGNAMDQSAFVGVSVDPANDTRIEIVKFVQLHNLEGKLHYVSGTPEQLQPVWAAYAVYVAPAPADNPLSSVAHSTRVILIDKAGNERANFGSDFDPADLVFDIRALLSE